MKLLALLVALAVSLGGTDQPLNLPFIGSDINEVAGFVAALSMAVLLLVVEVTAARIITSTAANLTARRRARVLHSFFTSPLTSIKPRSRFTLSHVNRSASVMRRPTKDWIAAPTSSRMSPWRRRCPRKSNTSAR